MKKVNSILISILVGLIVLSSIVLAVGEENAGVPTLLSQIKEVLVGILEKLSIIAEKETTVVIEPNITVNPEIVIPEQECEWETYSQVNEDVLEGDGKRVLISIPENQMVKEINITKAYVLFRWVATGSDESIISVNGIECLRVGAYNLGDRYFMKSLNPNCLSAFNVGLDEFYIDNLGRQDDRIDIKTLFLEMEVKPANC